MITSNAPHALTPAEWDEIAALDVVREGWGFYGAESGRELASVTYASRFNFSSGGPGYSGELYVILGDALGVPPLMLIRDWKTRRLEQCPFESAS